MKNALCPHCNNNLHHQRLKLVYTHMITQRDPMLGTNFTVKRNEYECPFCGESIMVTGGRIVKVFEKSEN